MLNVARTADFSVFLCSHSESMSDSGWWIEPGPGWKSCSGLVSYVTLRILWSDPDLIKILFHWLSQHKHEPSYWIPNRVICVCPAFSRRRSAAISRAARAPPSISAHSPASDATRSPTRDRFTFHITSTNPPTAPHNPPDPQNACKNVWKLSWFLLTFFISPESIKELLLFLPLLFLLLHLSWLRLNL